MFSETPDACPEKVATLICQYKQNEELKVYDRVSKIVAKGGSSQSSIACHHWVNRLIRSHRKIRSSGMPGASTVEGI